MRQPRKDDPPVTTALYRDKEGQVVYRFPFILVIDPIVNQGLIFQDEEAVDIGFLDNDLLEGATPENILPMLAQRGYRVYYLRSDADMEDEILPYFAVADGQLQEIIAALWVRQDFDFEGAEHVVWEETTTRLYTDGESVLCEGHLVVVDLPAADARRAPLEAKVLAMLETFAHDVAVEVRAPLRHVTKRA
ncbi:MAG: hypothetical protein JWM80_6718 [Cyanobacteria bacterium RYN_339]|nr:hypothetical protein [Cyanobacteria bacterium RYN_339]